MLKGLEPLSSEEMLGEPGLLRLEKGRLGWISPMSINTRLEGVEKREPNFSQQCPPTGNGHKPKPRKFHPNTGKRFFTVRVVKHCYRLPREVCRVSALGDFQNLTGHGCEKPALGERALLEQVVGLTDLKRSLPTSTIW